MTTFITKDSANTDREFDFDGDGTTSSPFVARSRTLLGATNEGIAATPSASAGLNGLIKGLWTSLLQLGTASEAASSIGSIHAKLRFIISDTLGTTTDAANADGTLMARERLIARAFREQNTFTRFGTSVTDTISASPAWLLSGFIHNRNTSIRYFQIFNRTTNPPASTVPLVSIPLAPNFVHPIVPDHFGSKNGFFCSTGLAWGFSTTEGTYTAGASADVSVNLFWRAN